MELQDLKKRGIYTHTHMFIPENASVKFILEYVAI